MFMKRFGTLLGMVFLGSLSVGCGGGIPEGAPAEMPKSSQTVEFKNMMKTAGENMQRKGKGAMKKGAGAPTAKQDSAPEAQ
jgi:hypothetical protein